MDEEAFNNIKQEIDNIIYERSKYLITKKFEKYSSEISKIYSQFNINKSRRIDALGSPQIDINYLDQILILILKEVNLFLLELSSPKDIFISFFLITSQKENEMEAIIKNIQHEIISKNLTDKYNNIFYEEKIIPMFIKYRNNNIINNNTEDEEIIDGINIGEYNSKGKKVKNAKKLYEENEINKKKYNNAQIKKEEKNKSNILSYSYSSLNKTNNFNISFQNNLGPNILYIETLRYILSDYIKLNPNIALVEIDEEFSSELNLYNKNLLYKIKEYDELYIKNKNREKNINIIGNELNQNLFQLKQVQKNIELYAQLIKEKKEKNENTIFLEDMFNKLKDKEKIIIHKINQAKEKSFILNMKDKFNKYNKYNINPNNNLIESNELSSSYNNITNSINIIQNQEIPKLIFKNDINKALNRNLKIPKYKLSNSTTNINKKIKKFNIINENNNNYNKNTLTTKNSILKTISSKEKDNNIYKDPKLKIKFFNNIELTQDIINKALNEIFSFYSTLNNNNDSLLYFETFKKFCKDFKIFISDEKIESIFYDIIFDNNNENENKNVDIENKNKINFNQFKLAIEKLSLEFHEIKKQKIKKIITDKKNVMNYMELREYLRQEEEKNHNKFTEKITGGIAKKSLEKNQFDFLSKYKKLTSDINKYEFDYEKESKKSNEKILQNFYQFLGIGYDDNSNNCYKNKIKIKSNIFVENALKKYGYMDIFKNYQNFNNNNISLITGDNFNSNNNTNRNNSLTMRSSKKNNYTSNIFNFRTPNNNNISNNNNIFTSRTVKLNQNLNQLNFIHIKNQNLSNNRYNLKNIDELEEIELSNKYNTLKKMNKNFSAFELKGKELYNINNINNMNINLLPQINNKNNIRYDN